ncbi:hypothetical protein ABZ208_36005 [Streptomyces sp. NPDC006208]|uniref:hypothetical protein n=1 Tax=Streptomyces sp. NPDC006208 TaxID=3156734 RepID=UPI0033ABA633
MAEMTERDYACAASHLGANPSAPGDVLLRLLRTGDRDLCRTLAWRRELPEEVGDELVGHSDPHIRRLLADSWNADPELRARLLDGPPSDALVVAAGPMPYRTSVPPLPDWAYARLLSHPRDIVRYETLESWTVPAHVLVPLADHEDPLFRLAACRRVWDELTDGTRGLLLDDEDPRIRVAASLHVMHEDEERTTQLVAELAGDWRLGDVLKRGRLSRAVAERMVAEKCRLASLAHNPHLPADVVKQLATDPDPAVRLAVSARPGLTEQERAAIDWAVGPEDRLDTLDWVWAARDDAEVLRGCATSAHTWLRRSAAVCRGLPADLVELLASDEDFAVRLLLAEFHPAAPPELLLDLCLHGGHRAVKMLVTRPNFPVTGLAARFADDENPDCRKLVVRDPGATPEQIDRLSRDPDDSVRDRAGRDPRLPVARLRELLADPDSACSAAANPMLPADDMRTILDRAGIPA